jgi:DNA-directed RNA polymerase subunit H (RpoH/RPB5)
MAHRGQTLNAARKPRPLAGRPRSRADRHGPAPPARAGSHLNAGSPLHDMSHQIYPPIVIVRNLVSGYFQRRGLRRAPRGLANGREVVDISDDAIVSDMERFQYVRLDALRTSPRGARDWVVILVLSETGKYALHGPELGPLIEGIEAERPAKDGRLDELVIVAEESFFGKKYVMDVVREKRQKAREGVGAGPDHEGLAPFYDAHRYHVFSHIVPEHVSAGEYTVLSDEEAKKLLADFCLPRSALGVLFTNEAMAVWIGAREGQCVKVRYDSQTAAIGHVYLRVEKEADQ